MSTPLTTAYPDFEGYLSSIEEIVEDARRGRMFILVDDEDRENEGDLIVPAERATPEVVNFMAKNGRGLICLAMPEERCRELGLELMTRRNESRHETAFTVSIEARDGITTGISAADRAHTIQVAIDPSKGRGDIVSPGHVFPLMARRGGVLVRTGHTEAAVDIARLAGLHPAGVICEIMNDDGTMARMPDLVKFAQLHGLKIARIADLIAYRRRHDTLVTRAMERTLDSVHGGQWRTVVYVDTVNYSEHIALVKGDVSGDDPVLVRVHALNVVQDVLGERRGQGGVLQAAMRRIGEEGRGIVVLVRETNPLSITDRIRFELGDNDAPRPLRDYGIGAQILLDLGVRRMVLLTNAPRPIIGLEGYGLSVVDRLPVLPRPTEAKP
ncbi:MAG: 3,4-dihydroxy-2-butanone-4-phosphate synthase [Alphaproteobacteria bacterium]|nr:3,4-dihydroxy-2-butanone-4-phosphate synthase [Alphaproteobacteria bacterium]